MACFNIPGDAELSADGSTLLLTSGSKRLAQRLRVGLRTIQGTYKFDLRQGIAWFDLLEKPNNPQLQATIRDFFLAQPEVSAIRKLEFRVNRTTRLMSVDYTLQMADGDVVEASSDITPLT